MLNGKLEVNHSKVDGTDEQTTILFCDHIAPIYTNELLPRDVPTTPTLYFPVWEYPIADFIHVDPGNNRVTIIQISFRNATAKVPNINGNPNPYHAIYNTGRWKSIFKNYKYNNYAEEILYILGEQTTIIQNQKTKMLDEINNVSGVQIPARLLYLVFTAKPIETKNNNIEKTAIEFPWARIVYKNNLSRIFSPEFMKAIEGNEETL